MSALQALIFGMGGAAAYQYKDSILEFMQKGGHVDLGPAHYAQGNERMSRELEELRKTLLEQQRQQGVTVVHSGGKNGSSLVAYPALALAAYIVYLRVVKGYKLTDLMYVSKAALQQSVGQVKDGMEKIKSQMENTKKFLQRQMDQLSAAQKELLSSQNEMGSHLGLVDSNVLETKQGVDKVSGAVRQLDDRLINVTQSQQYTEKGVYLLCTAVQEIMYINGTPSKHANALTDFLRSSPPLRIEERQPQPQRSISNTTGVQGLEGLQKLSDHPTRCVSRISRIKELKGSEG